MLLSHIPRDDAAKRVISAILTREVGLAGFCVLIWDHAITLDEEVCLVWKRIPDIDRKDYRRMAFCILFLLNRYVVPLSFLINLIAYFSTLWTFETCSHFVVYEGIMTMVGIALADLIMLSRVEALWRDSKYHWYAAGGLFTLWSTFITVNSWLLAHTGPCTMVFDKQYERIAPASAWLPLLYDTTVIILTLMRTWPSRKGGRLSTNAYVIGAELLREGVLYYGVIFGVTFSLTLMIAFAPAGIQNICAQLELCLTSAMMSRITLTLKRRFASDNDMPYEPSPIASLDWRAVTHPARVIQGRGRVQFVERVQGNTSMFAIVSHITGEEDAIISVARIGDERDSVEVEMVEIMDKKEEGSESPV
ncbi:hypothetical protein PENSPDRAFT_667872 [Peniophora sp. CONT]|nr:hypothetical protein PENSPDRAFT_667872 [Peniophora sp. CONT]